MGRLGGAAGIVFVALTLGGVIEGDVPVYTQGPTAIKAWFADNADSYLAGLYLMVFGGFFFLLFLAVLVAVLTHADGADSPWPRLALLTGALTFVAVMGSVGFDPTLAVLKGDVSDDLARALSAGTT